MYNKFSILHSFLTLHFELSMPPLPSLHAQLLDIIERHHADFNQVNAATAYYRLGRLWSRSPAALRAHPAFLTLGSLLEAKVGYMNLVSISGLLDAHLSLRITPAAVLRQIPARVLEQLREQRVAWDDLGIFLLIFCRVFGAPGGWTPNASTNSADISDLLLKRSTVASDPDSPDSVPSDPDRLASADDIDACFRALCVQTNLRIRMQPPKGFVAALLVSDGVAGSIPEAQELYRSCLAVLGAPGESPLATWDARSTCVLLYAVAYVQVADRAILERIVSAVLAHIEGTARRPEPPANPPPPPSPPPPAAAAASAASAAVVSPKARKARPERQTAWIAWDRLFEFEVSRTAYSLAKVLERLVLANAALDPDAGSDDAQDPRLSTLWARNAGRDGPRSVDEQATLEETLQLAFEQSASAVLGAEGVQKDSSGRPDLVSSLAFEMRLREFSKGPTESLILKALARFAERFPSDPRTFSFRSIAAVLYAYALTQGHQPPLLTSCEHRVSFFAFILKFL